MAAHRADAWASVDAYILPLIFRKHRCRVIDDALIHIAAEVSPLKMALQPAKAVHAAPRGSVAPEAEGTPQVLSAAKDNRGRFYLPPVSAVQDQPIRSIIRKLPDKIGEGVTTIGQLGLHSDRLYSATLLP